MTAPEARAEDVETLADLIADGVVSYFESVNLTRTAPWTEETRDDEHEIARQGQARESARSVLASPWLAERERAASEKAWDEGWCVGASNVFAMTGEKPLPQPNPYERAEVTP